MATKTRSETPPSDGLAWLPASGGYHVTLVDGKLAYRNPKGQRIQSQPKALQDDEVVERLEAVVEWLATHERECRETVETWMLRSLPVPKGILSAVWADPAWRKPLENAVVAPIEDLDRAGFFKGVDPERGVGVVNLDGETDWIDTAALRIPHPTLLAELATFRELAQDLGFEQGISQLLRETFTRPADLEADATDIGTWANAKFEALNHALGRCRSLGYRVRGGYACCPVFEAPRPSGRDGGVGEEASARLVEARFWIGAEDPEYETETGDLGWVDEKERAIRVADVGPVALSEGMRMAAAIAAGAKETEEKED